MNFDQFNIPPIYFGRGKVQKLAEITGGFGKRPLLVYGGAESIVETIKRALPSVTPVRQRGEPTVADIDRLLAKARQLDCDVVIAIGGGSVIDAAKAVAGLLTNGGVASDYMEVVGRGQKITKATLPWIALPTTGGTGAEVTRNAVIGWPEKKFKASIRSEHLLTRAVIVDPELAVDVPPDVTARSGMDALCQCIESFVSTGAQPITDALAIKGIELAGQHLARAFADSHNLDAREGMALAALLSGIALTNAGLGAVHGFAAALGANFPVPHGTVCGLLLPHVVEANVAALRQRADGAATLDKYAAAGRALTGDRTLSDAEAIKACRQRCADLVRDLKLPPLREFGISEGDVPELTTLAKRASSMRYNPVPLDDQTLRGILRDAL